MSESKGEWKFNRGSLKAHFIVDGKAVCGSGSKYESTVPDLPFEKYKCQKCKAKLEIMQWKKKGLCPYCGKEGKPYLFTIICEEHGEYWDAIYLRAIDELLNRGQE